MRILNEKHEEISMSEVDLSKGKMYVTRIIKPDAKPVDNIEKFAYADDDYEEVQIFERIPDEILNQRRIQELKRMLSETDYVIVKISEGSATREEYSETIAERKKWREEINHLENRQSK